MFWTRNCIFGSASSVSFLTIGIYSCVSVGWSWWYCQLVSNTCWLVWAQVAPKVLQSAGYYLCASKEYNGTNAIGLYIFFQNMVVVCLHVFISLHPCGIWLWFCVIQLNSTGAFLVWLKKLRWDINTQSHLESIFFVAFVFLT